jgi:O-antigen/teichoic acid export membrane protein
MGREQLTRVATGLIVAQIVFALTIFAFIKNPEAVIWVPVLRIAGDLAMVLFFGYLFAKTYGRLQFAFSLRGAIGVIKPAFTMGASHGMAQVSYNFDSVLLGFMLGPMAVGWYNAAYRPITALLAMPVTYFLGLFPVLSRTYSQNQDEFREVVTRSMRLMSIFALPVAVGGTLLAGSAINFLFGPSYANSVLPLQILSWSAALVVLRGTFRQSLNAAGHQGLDLRCAGAATGLNVSLNLVLIPFYGIAGAAFATLLSEVLWLTLAWYYFNRYVVPLNVARLIVQPAIAAVAMAAVVVLASPLNWIVQGVVGGTVYFCVLLLLGEKEVWSWLRFAGYKPRLS